MRRTRRTTVEAAAPLTPGALETWPAMREVDDVTSAASPILSRSPPGAETPARAKRLVCFVLLLTGVFDFPWPYVFPQLTDFYRRWNVYRSVLPTLCRSTVAFSAHSIQSKTDTACDLYYQSISATGGGELPVIYDTPRQLRLTVFKGDEKLFITLRFAILLTNKSTMAKCSPTYWRVLHPCWCKVVDQFDTYWISQHWFQTIWVAYTPILGEQCNFKIEYYACSIKILYTIYIFIDPLKIHRQIKTTIYI